MENEQRLPSSEVISFIKTKMIPNGASEEEMDAYVEEQGYTFDELKSNKRPEEEPTLENTSPIAGVEPMGDWNADEYGKGEWSQMMRKRDYNIMVTARDELSGEIGDWEAAWQNVTQSIGKGVDTAEHFVISPVLNTLGDAGSELGRVLANAVNAGQGSIDFDNKQMNSVREGVKDELKPLVKWYMGLDRNTRKNIDGVGLLAAIMPYSSVAARTKSVVEGTGNVLRKSLDKQTRRASSEMIDVPPNMLSKVEKANRVDKMDANGNVIPDADDIAQMKAVESLEDFTSVHGKLGGKSSVHRRYKAIREGVAVKSIALDKILEQDGSIVKIDDVEFAISEAIDKKMFESKLTFQKLLAEEGSGKMNLDTIGEISNVLKDQANVAIERAVKNSKNGTLDSKSLHDARKLFDTEIRKGKKDWDSSDYKIKDALQKAVRNGMNNIVDSSTKNPTVSSRRIEVMHLIDAKNKANLVVQDYVVLNPIREAFKVVSGVGRTQYLGQILSQSARTVGAVGAASLVKGGIATTVVVGGIGFGITVVAGRVLMSRKARSGMLKLVTMLDKGIKSSTKAADKIAHRKAKREIIELISKATIIENKEAEDVN